MNRSFTGINIFKSYFKSICSYSKHTQPPYQIFFVLKQAPPALPLGYTAPSSSRNHFSNSPCQKMSHAYAIRKAHEERYALLPQTHPPPVPKYGRDGWAIVSRCASPCSASIHPSLVQFRTVQNFRPFHESPKKNTKQQKHPIRNLPHLSITSGTDHTILFPLASLLSIPKKEW